MESISFHHHYDGRFAEKPVEDHDQVDHLTALMQSYLATMADIGVET